MSRVSAADTERRRRTESEAKKTLLENPRIGAIVPEAFKEIVGINGSP